MAWTWLKDAAEVLVKAADKYFAFRYFFMVFIICATVVFAANPVLHWLGLPLVPPFWRMCTVILGLSAVCGSAYFPVETGCKRLYSQRELREQKEGIRRHLLNLPTDQKAVLMRYAESGKSSLHFNLYDGAVRDLANRGILYRSSEAGHGGLYTFPYTLTPIACEFMTRAEFQKILLNQQP